jgi:hypothetical protein
MCILKVYPQPPYFQIIIHTYYCLETYYGIGSFKMIVDKYGNYVRKFMWQLCG